MSLRRLDYSGSRASVKLVRRLLVQSANVDRIASQRLQSRDEGRRDVGCARMGAGKFRAQVAPQSVSE